MNVLWLQSGGCGGCTMSLLCAESPGLLDTLANAGVELLWHPSLSEASGAEVITLLERLADGSQPLDVLCVEGSILRGPNGTGAFHRLAGTDTAMLHWVQRLADKAEYTLAIGSCAAFGGITAAGCNPTDACGLQYDGHLLGGALGKDYHARSGLPVINVAGCPTHPGWITETLMLLALQGMQLDELDSFCSPAFLQ